jgi:hypothetical protein
MQKRIEAYNLVEFIQMIVKETKDGYDIDFNDNTSVPTGALGWYKCVVHKGSKIPALLKPKPEPVIEQQVNGIAAEDIPEVEPFVPSIVFEVKEPTPKPRGRPKASRV